MAEIPEAVVGEVSRQQAASTRERIRERSLAARGEDEEYMDEQERQWKKKPKRRGLLSWLSGKRR